MSPHQVGESWHLDDVTDEATDEPIGPRIMHAVHMRSQCGRRVEAVTGNAKTGPYPPDQGE